MTEKVTRRSTVPRSQRATGGRLRAITIRALAILVGLLPLLLCETGLRLAGWGRLSDSEDPYIGFSDVHSLFRRNEASGYFEIDDARLGFFRPDRFKIKKPANGYRVFCLGGSTVQGRPHAIETSFTTWLELSLKAADPSREWNVVNCGGVSYASYRLAPIMKELLAYQPDLFILYTGQNEFLEDRTYGEIKRAPTWLTTIHVRLTRLRTYNALRAMWNRLADRGRPRKLARRPQLPAEVDALLDYRDGLADYHRDDKWHDSTVQHYRFNVLRMVQMAHSHGLPIILVNPVTNLQDTPPFKFAHRDGLSQKKKEEFERLWNLAKQPDRPIAQRIDCLQQAVTIDRRHAGVLYHLGRSYLAAGQVAQAKRLFIRAKDEDICPLRMVEPMYEALAQVAGQTDAPLVDARRLFEQLTPNGIPGNSWLVDHVHPSIRGHQKLAERIFQELTRLGIVTPSADWKTRRDQAYQGNLSSLPSIYYLRGQQRLKGLISWTKGRAPKIKPGRTGTTAEPDR